MIFNGDMSMGVNNFPVVLEKVGKQPLQTMRILQNLAGLSLSQAKNVVDNAPAPIKAELNSTKVNELKNQLEAVGNIVSVSGVVAETQKETKPVKKAVEKKPKAKAKSKTQSEIVEALLKAKEIVGADGFSNGERVCNLLGDLVPKLEKERRRIKMAYASKAVDVLMSETDKSFAVNEAVKRLTDYSDMADSVAKATIFDIYEALK